MTAGSVPPFRKLLTETLCLDMTLPWSIYDRDHHLLLRRGERIDNPRTLELLLQNASYRDYTEQELAEVTKGSAKPQADRSPFLVKQRLASDLAPILRALAEGTAERAGAFIGQLAAFLQTQCTLDPDGLLAAVHLTAASNYAVLHPLHSAILCELLADRLHWSAERRTSLLAAALTMNVGMLDLQGQLFEQREALSAAQKEAIAQHSEASVKALVAAGVTDEVWLRTVHQHHERIDGSGYPGHLRGEDICQEAKILALADMYAAMLTPRKHRPPILARDALRSIFLARGKIVDEELAGLFIREIGIFPPGVFVRLANGDIAVVARRAIVSHERDSTAPVVYSVLSAHGVLYEPPRCHDCHDPHYHIEAMCVPNVDLEPVIRSIWKQVSA